MIWQNGLGNGGVFEEKYVASSGWVNNLWHAKGKDAGQMAIYFKGEYKNHITNQVIGTCIMQ